MATVVQRAGVNDNDYELTISVTTSVDTDTQAVTVRVVEGGSRENIKYPVSSGIITRLGRI